MHADRSSLNYPVKANFRIEITKVLAHRNTWVLAGTFGSDQINRKMELTRVELREVNYKLFHTGRDGSLILIVNNE